MMKPRRIAYIGNSLPRRCGIATFTTDLQHATARSRSDIDTCIVAMTDRHQSYDYPQNVAIQIKDERIDDYVLAADFLNAGKFDVVSLQHEFGIFGGESGDHIMALLSRLNMPVVTTFHTVLDEPAPAQHDVMGRVLDVSSKAVVMARKAGELLRAIYRVQPEKIEIIPHGIPDFAFVEPDEAKARFGFAGRAVILTFGLLSPNKGIEVMIDAMPTILKAQPNAVYVVLGATHPNLVWEQGEAYRESLMKRVQALDIQDHVVFLDQFVDKATLLAFISMCDVYVTPYLTEAQMTSGTLSYSFGLGKAVVSTPYWHARELLDDGRGVLVPFGDAAATGIAIAELLTNDIGRLAMRKRAYASSRAMTWERTAERYLAVFESARRGHGLKEVKRPGQRAAWDTSITPEMCTSHLQTMCDDTGIIQHAVYSVPDRAHGYCVDDNARALLLSCKLSGAGEQPLPEVLTSRFASFIQHAWNPDTKRFRNFMSFNRTWLEDTGSEDSHGRTLWALGECAHSDSSPSRRRWAAALFAEALPSAETFQWPRAWAFTLLGLDAYCAAITNAPYARHVRHRLADRLLALFSKTETPDWMWFENGLSYDNARLSQAMILAGMGTGTPAHLDAGLRSLRWLMTVQTAPEGHFRPVGSHTFGDERQPPKPFDQQALEAAATISACLAAWRAEGKREWKAEAARAFAWFLGHNDLSIPLVDLDTGACRDGLHPDSVNENQGAESVLSYLIGLAEIRQLARMSGERAKLAPVRALRV